MDVRDRVAVVLTTVAVGAAFAGSWIVFGFGVALLVVAALLIAGALLLASGTADVVVSPVEQTAEEPVQGDPPDVAHVRLRSPVAIVKREAG